MFPSIVTKQRILKPQTKRKEKVTTLVVTGDNVHSARQKRVRRKPIPIHPYVESYKCDCNSLHLTQLRVTFAPKSRKRGASTVVLSMTTLGSTCQTKRIKLRSKKPLAKVTVRKKIVEPNYENDELFVRLENQLKALNLKPQKKSKGDDSSNEQQANPIKAEGGVGEEGAEETEAGEVRRRGRRRRKGRQSVDRLTSAGLVAQSAQDPETQIAGIGSDSHNPSSRGSVAPTGEDSLLVLPVIKVGAKKIDSFLDDDILKFLHREVDENAIETEFDTKRRYVLEEAFRTRPEREYGEEMQALLKEMKGSAVSLGNWLHIPRVFSRKNAQFSLPLDSQVLETLGPMQYAARYVTLKKSKQLLYLTVLQKFRPMSYKMPVNAISDGLMLMMGGILTAEQADCFRQLMAWEDYEEDINFTDDIKLKLTHRKELQSNVSECGDGPMVDEKTIKYRTWCGVCAICERSYGRFHSREHDPPDGMELSDFSMLETKLTVLKVDRRLVEVLNVIRTR